MNDRLIAALEQQIQQNAQLLEAVTALVQAINQPRHRRLIYDPNDPQRVIGAVDEPAGNTIEQR